VVSTLTHMVVWGNVAGEGDIQLEPPAPALVLDVFPPNWASADDDYDSDPPSRS
jgi:hypothetical protein